MAKYLSMLHLMISGYRVPTPPMPYISNHRTVRGEAKLSKRIHPEVIGAQHGFGSTALGRQTQHHGVPTAF